MPLRNGEIYRSQTEGGLIKGAAMGGGRTVNQIIRGFSGETELLRFVDEEGNVLSFLLALLPGIFILLNVVYIVVQLSFSRGIRKIREREEIAGYTE